MSPGHHTGSLPQHHDRPGTRTLDELLHVCVFLREVVSTSELSSGSLHLTGQHPRRAEAMETIERALEGLLRQTVTRLKSLGGTAVLEDYRGALEENGQDEAGGDAVSVNEERELTFAARDRLVERANRLAQARDRFRSGEYGLCEVCGRPIPPARLRAIPEVSTCVACQEAEERRARGASVRVMWERD
jgi:RNA polymerase-binding transcription factor DksA